MVKEEDMQNTSDLITDISQLDPDRLYTYADYLKWCLNERVELINGRLFKIYPTSSRLHQEISRELSLFIFNFFSNYPCEAFAAPFDVRLPGKNESGNNIQTVVQPDLCVICDPAKLDDKGCIGAPDWIIEILSPGNTKKEMDNKFSLYEESVVGEYWLVDPGNESVLKYVLDDEGKYIGYKPVVHPKEIIPESFPGLKIDLGNVFPKK